MACHHVDVRPPVCFIAPPHVLARMIEEGTPEQRSAALRTIAASASMRTRRTLVTQLMGKLGIDVPALAAAPPGENLSVYDVRHGGRDALPGQKMRGEGDPPVADAAVNQAYDGADLTYRFYQDVLGRNSVDGNGLELTSSVHYSNQFENAFWDGNQMVYGDGGGQLFI
ncbi:MAG: hypothetical protein QOE27_590, partial [Solirubrobacteraceae bacterium]|nr:hypothetical protein [Solirubrobacteraceae bacterium]